VKRGIKSNRVGRATLSDGVVVTAYRAVVDFMCVQCAGAIMPGALFSRRSRSVPVGALSVTQTTDPVCVTCRPLRLEAAVARGGAADEPPTDPRI